VIAALIALILLLIGFMLGNIAIILMGASLLAFYLANEMRKPKMTPSPAGEAVRYKHTLVNSEPPKEHVLTPAELGAPFHPLLEATLADKKANKGDVRSDALPIFRADPKNPAMTLFNALPINPFRELWDEKPKKEKEEKKEEPKEDKKPQKDAKKKK
jgi:hypothetical protein